MSLLFSHEIKAAVGKELSTAKKSIQIISAYCKLNALKQLHNQISKDIESKKLMLRFRMDDILKHSTDFEILDFCNHNGWEVYLRFDLHAKTYIVDNKRGIVGSANLTSKGLGFTKAANLEMGSLLEIEPQDITKIDKMYKDAIKVDKELYKNLKQQIENYKKSGSEKIPHWSNEITDLFHPQVDILFSYEFPESKEVSANTEFFLDISLDADREQLKEAFQWCNAYLWLVRTLRDNQGCLYFGALSEKLHNTLVSDPRPYRKEVKELLANLLAWVEELGMEEIVIDRPRHSQRIRLL